MAYVKTVPVGVAGGGTWPPPAPDKPLRISANDDIRMALDSWEKRAAELAEERLLLTEKIEAVSRELDTYTQAIRAVDQATAKAAQER